MIDCVVAPLLHNHEFPVEAVNTTLLPSQKVVAPFAVMSATGNWLTVTAVEAETSVQPPACVTVTEKLPVALTVIDCVVAPLLHKYEEPVLAVNTTEPPWQKLTGPPAMMLAGTVALIVNVTAVLVALSQPAMLLNAAA